MSDGTGYLIAAYIITLATVFGYAVVLIAGNRAAARRLEEARTSHEKPGGTAADNATGATLEEAGHV